VDKVRVLLANRPKMLRDLLHRSIDAQPDMEVVGEETDPVELLLRVRETETDVVVVTLPGSGEDPGICSHLLFEYPALLVLAVSDKRDLAVLYRLSIDRHEIEGGRDEALLGAIRSARDPVAPQAIRKSS